MVVFYRSNTIGQNTQPVDTIQCQEFDQFRSWDDLTYDGNQFLSSRSNADILACSRSPKNIGNSNHQLIWYCNDSVNITNTASCYEITRSDGNLGRALEDAKDWLNDYVAPHQLVSIMTHEDDHVENENNVVRVVIVHRAGRNPIRLADSTAKEGLPRGGIYTLYTTSDKNETWDDRVNEAVDIMNKAGG